MVEFDRERLAGFRVEPAESPPEQISPRTMLAILLDCSASMGPRIDGAGREIPGTGAIHELRDRVYKFISNIPPALKTRCEIAIGAFNEPTDRGPRIVSIDLGVRVAQTSPFFWARNVSTEDSVVPGPLSISRAEIDGKLAPSGRTPMGAAIEFFASAIRQRRSAVEGIEFHPRPFLIVLSDGAPTDDLTAATKLVHDMETNGELGFWMCLMDGTEATVDVQALANKGNLLRLGSKGLGYFFEVIDATPNLPESRRVEQMYAALAIRLGASQE